MSKVKILYFVDSLEIGGIQTVLLNWINNLDSSRYQIDILTLDYDNESNIEKELEKLKVNVYKINGIKLEHTAEYLKYVKYLNAFFRKNNDYKVVHIHASSKNYLILKYAKNYNIPIRISHSHSTNFSTTNPLKKVIGNILKRKIIKYSTDYFACSYEAGVWLFGKKNVKSTKFKIIKNSIDYNKYEYNTAIRNRIRSELGISKNIVLLGHVGRLVAVKNHQFLLQVFDSYHKKNKNSKLLIVGNGELLNSIKEQVKKIGLTDDVIFTGSRDDVNYLLQAMDFFVMPSLYEGLPMVLVEAQASGLKCIVSNKVSTEAKLSNTLKFISLEEKPDKWAAYLSTIDINRDNNYSKLEENGFLIETVIKELEKVYLR